MYGGWWTHCWECRKWLATINFAREYEHTFELCDRRLNELIRLETPKENHEPDSRGARNEVYEGSFTWEGWLWRLTEIGRSWR